MSIDITTATEAGALIATATGRIDSRNAQEFEQTMSSAIGEGAGMVILDLAGLSYISSAGLRAILVTAKTLRKREAKFALCSLQSSIKEVMEISGFDQVIAIHPSKEEALSAFGASA